MPKTDTELKNHLHRIDGRGYPAYKDIRGDYRFPHFTLLIDHVQGDPFAAPSRLRARVPMQTAQFPADTFNTRSREIALRDFLSRAFAHACRAASQRGQGSGKSGLIHMHMPGQEILERSAVVVTPDFVEARFTVGLPANGRRIRGRHAADLLTQIVPRIVESALIFSALNRERLYRHINTAEDADTLREQLSARGLAAFVADGSILPRRSGVDDRPLSGTGVIPFRSPDTLRVTVQLPHAGEISGMGIRHGVTLIVGGGYHGKSTLLSALERGVYNHIPGDGRELVITEPSAVKIRAEDGRRVEGVDIRPFIGALPNGANTAAFRTENASGSTSQAANIIEALEVGAQTLLLDEDTCATNLMIRDARMQALVEKAGEPITPFVDRVRALADERGVSSILVLGGSGDYFDVADTVIRMDAYVPRDVTTQAKEIAAAMPTGRHAETSDGWPFAAAVRVPLADSLNPRKGKRAVSIKGRALRAVLFGTEEIDVSMVAQLVDEGQVRAIGQALNLAREKYMRNSATITEIAAAVQAEIAQCGLDALDTRPGGDFVTFRPYEFAAALNRLRTLRVK